MNGKEFTEKHGLSIEAHYIKPSENVMKKENGTITWKPYEYECKLHQESTGKVFGFRYTIGVGCNKEWMRYNQPFSRNTVYNVEKSCLAYHNPYHRPVPKLSQALESLAMDISCLTDYQSFEAWAQEFGYDTDSRAAEKIYNACKDELARLTEAFGPDFVRELSEVHED